MAENTETETTETAEPKEPRRTRATILDELKAEGYTGPTSFSKPDLEQRLSDVRDGTYTGKGSPHEVVEEAGDVDAPAADDGTI